MSRDSQRALEEWRRFIGANTYIFRGRPDLLFQQATCQPPQSAPAIGAEARWRDGLEKRPRLRWINPMEERDPSLTTLSGHQEMVVALAFSQDARQIISASRDDTIRTWDAESGRELTSLTVPYLTGSLQTQRVCNAAFSPDGARLLIASDRDLKIHDVHTGAVILALDAHAPAAWVADGRAILAGSGDITKSEMMIWDTTTGEARLTLGQTGAFIACALSPDGTRVLLSAIEKNRSQQLTLWDAVSGARLGELVGHVVAAWACGFSGDGRRVITTEANDRGQTHVWDVESFRSIFTKMNGVMPVVKCSLSPDGEHAAGIRGDGSITVWDVTQKAEVAWLSPEEAKLWGLGPLAAPAYSPDGKRLLTPSVNGTIRVWDAEDLAAGSYFSKNLGQISHLEFSPDKRRVLIWNHYDRPGGWFEVVEDSVGVYDAETCELIKPLGDASTHMYGGKHINACGYTRDGTQIFTVTEDRGLETRTVTRLFSAETLEQVEVSIDTPMPERRKAEASDADSHLVAETWGEFLELKDNKTGRLIATFVMLGNGGVAGCGVNGKVIAGDSVGRLYFLQLEEPPLPSL